MCNLSCLFFSSDTAELIFVDEPVCGVGSEKSRSAINRAKQKLFDPMLSELNRLKHRERQKQARLRQKEKRDQTPLTRAQEEKEEARKVKNRYVFSYLCIFFLDLLKLT